MGATSARGQRAVLIRRAAGLGAAALLMLSLAGPSIAAVATIPPVPRALSTAIDPACGTVPIDVEIILDTSGSMTSNSNSGSTRAQWAQVAIDQLIDDLQLHGGVGTGPATSSGGRHRVRG